MLNHTKLLQSKVVQPKTKCYSLIWFIQNQTLHSNVVKSKPMCIVLCVNPPHKTYFQELVAENLIRANGLIFGHLNSATDNGIILMMPGLPASRSGTIVDHFFKEKTVIKSNVAKS